MMMLCMDAFKEKFYPRYQKAKSLTFRAPTRLPDAQVEDVNHCNSIVYQTGGPGPGVHRELLHIGVVEISTLLLPWYGTNSVAPELVELCPCGQKKFCSCYERKQALKFKQIKDDVFWSIKFMTLIRLDVKVKCLNNQSLHFIEAEYSLE